MNGYTLTRKWFDFCFENKSAKVYHSSLYLWIVELNNRLGWKKEFGLPTQATMDGLSIGNKATYLEALKDLVSWGFIDIISEAKNQFQSTIISICYDEKATAKATALDIALQQQDQQQGNSTGNSIDTSIVPIIKQLNNKTIKLINKHPDLLNDNLENWIAKHFKENEATPEKDLVLDFDTFWQMYNYKEGKDSAKKSFEKTTAKDRELIKAHLPNYIKNTQISGSKTKSDLKFRKHPTTYLNQRCYVDALENKVNDIHVNIFEGLRFFYKNVPSEIYMDRDKCIAIPDSVFGYNKRVISYPEYTKFRNFLTQNGIDLDNLPAITFEPELFTKKEPIEILKLWIGKN